MDKLYHKRCIANFNLNGTLKYVYLIFTQTSFMSDKIVTSTTSMPLGHYMKIFFWNILTISVNMDQFELGNKIPFLKTALTNTVGYYCDSRFIEHYFACFNWLELNVLIANALIMFQYQSLITIITWPGILPAERSGAGKIPTLKQSIIMN